MQPVAARLAAAAVRHVDETGFRIGSKTRWLHSVSTTAMTYYRVCERRGAIFGQGLGPGEQPVQTPVERWHPQGFGQPGRCG